MKDNYTDNERQQIAVIEYETHRVNDIVRINHGQTTIGTVRQVISDETGLSA